jgi:hypothetical protein
LDQHSDAPAIQRIFGLWLRYHDAIAESCRITATMSHETGKEFVRLHTEAERLREWAALLRSEAIRLS